MSGLIDLVSGRAEGLTGLGRRSRDTYGLGEFGIHTVGGCGFAGHGSAGSVMMPGLKQGRQG